MTSKFDPIDALKQKIDSAILIEDSLLQKLETRFRMEFNYNSNHLEGNTLSYTETKLLLIFDRTTGDHFLREYEEIKGHDVCWSLIRTWSRELDIELTEKHIKELNELLLVRPFWKEAITITGQSTQRQIQVGEYKAFPNSVVLKMAPFFSMPRLQILRS